MCGIERRRMVPTTSRRPMQMVLLFSLRVVLTTIVLSLPILCFSLGTLGRKTIHLGGPFSLLSHHLSPTEEPLDPRRQGPLVAIQLFCLSIKGTNN